LKGALVVQGWVTAQEPIHACGGEACCQKTHGCGKIQWQRKKEAR